MHACFIGAQEDTTLVGPVQLDSLTLDSLTNAIIAAEEEDDFYEEEIRIARPIKIDSSLLDQRSFVQEDLDDYKKDQIFNYEQDPKYENNVFRQLRWKFNEWLRKTFGNEGTKALGDVIYYLILIGGIGALLYHFIKGNKNTFFLRTATKQRLKLEEIDESVNLETLDDLLQAALKNKAYRPAIRLYYLKSLRLLDNHKMIKWQNFKTNYAYFKEIKQDAIKKSFDDMTRIYEFVWYGEFELTEDEFDEAKKDFENLFSKVRSEGK